MLAQTSDEDAGGPLASRVTARDAIRTCLPLLEGRPLLIVSDFDGTISRIELDPWAARIVPSARRALRRLAALPDVHVALLSGRLSRDVAARTRVGGATYVGNHGMERGRLGRGRRAEGLVVQVVAVEPALVDAAVHIGDTVAAAIAEPWLILERKPASVAFHFRGAPDLVAAAATVGSSVEAADPERLFARHPGRRVLELRPIDAPGKGDALEMLLGELHPAAAIVLGDDVTDGQAFRALRKARNANRVDGCAIAVQARAEVPREVLASADFVLGSPLEAARFLSGLARRLPPERVRYPPVTSAVAARSAAS